MLDEILQEEEEIAAEREAEALRLGTVILRLPIRELPTMRAPVCVSPETSVRSAITVMNANNAGCILIEENGILRGIFTERDVLTRVIGNPIDLDETPVSAFMTPDPEVLSQDDRTNFALNKMVVGGFRHIPLVDEEGRPTGVVSLRNVVGYMVELFRTEVLNLPPLGEQSPRTREGA